jgi:predicted RNA binding protein YcfA (HicA-like mRNA interferase family)
MSNYPSITGKQLIKALKKAGFNVIRIKGSHHFLSFDGRSTIVPVHSGETIGHGLLQKILKDCELNRDDLMQFL